MGKNGSTIWIKVMHSKILFTGPYECSFASEVFVILNVVFQRHTVHTQSSNDGLNQFHVKEYVANI